MKADTSHSWKEKMRVFVGSIHQDLLHPCSLPLSRSFTSTSPGELASFLLLCLRGCDRHTPGSRFMSCHAIVWAELVPHSQHQIGSTGYFSTPVQPAVAREPGHMVRTWLLRVHLYFRSGWHPKRWSGCSLYAIWLCSNSMKLQGLHKESFYTCNNETAQNNYPYFGPLN